MKKQFLLIGFLISGLFILPPAAAQYNLTRPEEKSIEINGEMYSFRLYKYDPPYLIPQYHFKDRAGQDISTPEGTHIAALSSVGRDREWYLSLFNKEARESLLERDKRSGGRILEEYSKGTPFPDRIKTGSYDEFLHKIEFEHNKKIYTVIYANAFIKGQEMPGVYYAYGKEGDDWLATEEIDYHPLKRFAALHSYEQLLELCRKGYWYTSKAEEPPRLRIAVIPSKREYEFREPLVFTVRIENIWREDVVVHDGVKPLGKHLRFTIENPRYQIRDGLRTPVEDEEVREEFAVLKPGGYKEEVYEIREYVDPERYATGYPPGRYIIEKDGTVYYPPGEYTVKAEYSTLGVDASAAPEGLAYPKNLRWEAEASFRILPGEEEIPVDRRARRIFAAEEEIPVERQERRQLPWERIAAEAGRADRELEVRVELSGQEYRRGEDIELKMTVKNIDGAGRDLKLIKPEPADRCVMIHIYDAAGEIVYQSRYLSWERYIPDGEDVFDLAFGEEIEISYVIPTLVEAKEGVVPFELPAGRYVLAAIYLIGGDRKEVLEEFFDVEVSAGHWTGAPVEFQIME